jgi:hypothetical protein
MENIISLRIGDALSLNNNNNDIYKKVFFWIIDNTLIVLKNIQNDKY